jgi:hypothetical protein
VTWQTAPRISAASEHHRTEREAHSSAADSDKMLDDARQQTRSLDGGQFRTGGPADPAVIVPMHDLLGSRARRLVADDALKIRDQAGGRPAGLAARADSAIYGRDTIGAATMPGAQVLATVRQSVRVKISSTCAALPAALAAITAGLERRNNGLETGRERSLFSVITVGKVWVRSLACGTRVPLTRRFVRREGIEPPTR